MSDSTAVGFTCCRCGLQMTGGTWIHGNIYCPHCTPQQQVQPTGGQPTPEAVEEAAAELDRLQKRVAELEQQSIFDAATINGLRLPRTTMDGKTMAEIESTNAALRKEVERLRGVIYRNCDPLDADVADCAAITQIIDVVEKSEPEAAREKGDA